MSDDIQENIIVTNDEVTLVELFTVLWKKKILITGISLIFAVSSVYYSLSLPNIYLSDVVLKVAGTSGSSLSSKSQLGGIAALAGVNLGKGDALSEKANLAKQVIRSRDFAKHISSFPEVLPALMALEEYDATTQSMVFIENLYDPANQKWLGTLPSENEVYKKYLSMVNVFIDPDTEFLAISIEHQSPYFAKYFLELIITELNNIERHRDITQAKRSTAYLTEQLGIYKVADIRNSINSLIQSQLETEMLANVRIEYLLRPLDSAYVPEKKSGPARAVICIAGTFIGFLLGIFFVFTNHYLLRKTS